MFFVLHKIELYVAWEEHTQCSTFYCSPYD